MGAAVVDTCFLINWARFSGKEKLKLLFDRLFMPEITFSEVKSYTALSVASKWLSERFLVLAPVLPANEEEIGSILAYVASHPQLPSIDPPELYALVLAKRLNVPFLTDNKAPKRLVHISDRHSSLLVLDSLDVLKMIADVDGSLELGSLVADFMRETSFRFSRARLREVGLLGP
ncbi:MAG TPA: hypothetical protein ENG43_01075 [Candidatus Bathyarchaeota archaeon]|nr:hypothetical protein [Candidatus Bathyarchaeota archaeon]HEW89920.1 hypothetical protein [Candidatus Bathyarchaeota archaeon]